MSINETIFDDLTIIKGIGPARQQWLRQSFGVRTYADLALLLPDQIEAMLKADGQIARRSAVEEWVAQAQTLTGTGSARPLLKLPSDEFADWHPFASFVVEIQSREENGRTAATRTAVQHIERDKNATWPGIEREKLCNWIVAQVDAEAQQFTQAHTLRQPVTAPIAPTVLHVAMLELSQPPHTTVIYRPERPLPIILCANQPFTTRLTLTLDPPLSVRTDVAVRVQSYIHGLQSRLELEETAVTTHHLAPNQETISQKLGSTTLTAGQYRLQLYATLPGSSTPSSYLELPLLQIIE